MAVEVSSLRREFSVTIREPGLRSALASVVRRRQRTVVAVDDVSLSVRPGEVVGFLGPNGSGKTTTLKCVAGLLTPTAGRVEVLGHTPSERRPEFLRRIGFVMGQRWQLHPDLPVRESFELNRIIYSLGREEFRRSHDELVEWLGLGDLERLQSRKLSLGQRMRCEFAAALLHRPSVVLLDEPTLGLDFEAQQQIRGFVREYVARTGAAVILTSHYIADISSLCERVLTISGGRITYSGSLAALHEMAGDDRRVVARLSHPLDTAAYEGLGRIVEHTEATLVVEVPKSRAVELLGLLEQEDGVVGVTLQDPPLEETLASLYTGGSA